jgi:hypothetical protein
MPAKKKAATKRTSAPAKGEMGPNLTALTEAGVVAEGYQLFSRAEKAAIETLSKEEVSAIISMKTKLGKNFFSRHASHAMYY